MRIFIMKLDASAAPGNAGAPQVVRDIKEKWVQFTAPFVGNYTIEISLDDGVTFAPFVTAISAPGFYQVAPPASFIRLRCVTLTSGTPAAVVAGYNDA